jgi:hypothetical protein
VSALNDEVRVSPFWDRGLATFTFGHETAEEREKGLLALFDAVTSVGASAESRAFGAKCCVSSPAEARLLVGSARRKVPGLKHIVVVRRDLVAQYGSLLRARSGGAWHSWRRPEHHPAARIRIRPLLFDRYVVTALDTLAILCTAHPVHYADYERIVADEPSELREIFRYLDLPDVAVDWCRGEKVSPPAAAYIDNYYEMRSRLNLLVERHAAGRIARSTRTASYAIDLAARCRRTVRLRVER